ncbi:hypothetical protein PMAYCL1PPCAC_12383, partial [Pristionchus mayeri]
KGMEWVMQTGNVPVAMPGKPGCLSGGGGGIVPPALLDERRLPPFYLEAIALCGATTPSALPHTALVYKLMVTSSLPRSVLSYIWSAVNRSLPGQLTRPEFFSALALIALAQRGESLAALCSMGALPLPTLECIPSTGMSENGGGEGTRMSTTPLTPSTPSIPTTSFSNINQVHVFHPDGFVPTTLLARGESGNEKKDALAISRNERSEVWERMMDAGEEIVQALLKLFDQRTNDVVREVCRTEKGSGVVSMVGLVLNVMERVSEADGRREMKKRVEKWHKKWRGIEQYSIREKREQRREEEVQGNQRCDLCNAPCAPSASISYGGRSYHGECANLWVNHIDPVLPIHIQ